MSPNAPLADVAVVAIGRNEGERLRACLASVVPLAACVVYVDSGSTDGSVAMARTRRQPALRASAAVNGTAGSSTMTSTPIARAMSTEPSVEPEST